MWAERRNSKGRENQKAERRQMNSTDIKRVKIAESAKRQRDLQIAGVTHDARKSIPTLPATVFCRM